MLLALAGLVFRNLFWAAEAIAIVSTKLTLWLWWTIVRRRLDARAAFVTVALLASNAYFFRYGYAVTTDALAIALQSAALAVLLLAGSSRAAAGAGALAALAFLTRYNAVYLLPAGIVALLLGGTSQAKRGAATLAYVGGFLAPVVPWVAYSLAHGSHFEFQLHHNIAYEVYARARGITWDDYQRDLQPQFHSLWDVIGRDPGQFARVMFTNLWHHAVDDAIHLTGVPVALCALAGVLLGARDGALKKLWAAWLAAGLLYLTLVPVFYSERYSLALLPAYAALAAVALASPRWAFAVRVPPRTVWLKGALAALIVVLALMGSWRFQARVIDQLPTEILSTADVLRPLAQPGDRVIARKAHLGFHAGGLTTVPFPFADSIAALAAYAHQQRARWLYVSWPEAELRPAFYCLLDTAFEVPGLTPFSATKPHPGVLYEIGPDFGIIRGWMRNDTLLRYHALRGRLSVVTNDPEALFQLAIVCRALGMTGPAQNWATLATNVQQGDPLRWVLLGLTAQENNDLKTSLAAYQQALTLDPENLDGRVGLGIALLAAGDSARAITAVEPVIDRITNPNALTKFIGVFEARHAAADAQRARQQLARLGAPR